MAIIAGLAAAGISHFMVDPKIKNLTTELGDTKDTLDRTQKSEAKFRKESQQLRAELDDTSKILDVATNELARVSARAIQQEQRANRAAAELETTTKERNLAQAELASWRATGLSPDQIKGVVDDLKSANEKIDVYEKEKDVLARNNKKLSMELAKVLRPNVDPEMQPMKGRVLAVDGKWNFVVVDIGSEQGAVERGVLLVNRDGKLVGKVRLTSVERNRSVANIIPEWKQAEFMEGDQVLY
ncbi:MAG TPA: hypothetical protein P5555_17040 [Candidatus Paceibacterota bacterium]|nr:hypothetical protein [Verrucomicrobiota bacterium]HRZ46886.1 hypothetical protein [Candidatus Paceibacterota bacterium]HRZ92493.1 hypothetical protein [Candidatus Paceibacterota bacterium]